MTHGGCGEASADTLFDLPCACQNLRRATRLVTRIYDRELTRANLDVTQFGLLTALAATGEVNQKRLSAGMGMDSTTLTRTLARLRKQGWVRVKPGTDRRERLFSLTLAGTRQLAQAKPHWDAAENSLRLGFGEKDWDVLKDTLTQLTKGAVRAEGLHPE
jgi:DNA-binding MarR family transcriptional regulator